MPQGTLFIIAAPSGGGKTTIVRELLTRHTGLVLSVSHTTRSPRSGEKDGINYFFIDQNKFDAMITADEFLEYASVFGNSYGTTRAWIGQQLQQGKDIILEIDWQGAQQIQMLVPGSVSIFIIPPSLEALEKRLRSRAQDDDATITRRMQAARHEISHFDEFQYLIINDAFEKAVADIDAIILTQRLKRERQQAKYSKLLSNLL